MGKPLLHGIGIFPRKDDDAEQLVPCAAFPAEAAHAPFRWLPQRLSLIQLRHAPEQAIPDLSFDRRVGFARFRVDAFGRGLLGLRLVGHEFSG